MQRKIIHLFELKKKNHCPFKNRGKERVIIIKAKSDVKEDSNVSIFTPADVIPRNIKMILQPQKLYFRQKQNRFLDFA